MRDDAVDAFIDAELTAARVQRARSTDPLASRALRVAQQPRPQYGLAADSINPPELTWRHNPTAWLEQRARTETWSKQREIMDALVHHRKVAVHSSHGPGKSFTASRATGWWLDVHPPGEAFVVTTAPTDAQVKAILWREINKMHAQVGLRGRTNLSEWYMGNELVALGRKPSDHSPTAFQGIHARFVLVVLDEACGVPQSLWDSASTLATNVNGRMLAIGNPDDPHSEFAKICKPGSGWHVIHISTLDTPNFTGEPVSRSLAEMLPSREWYEDRKLAWGEDSAIFTSKVLGQFPTEGDPFTALPYGWVSACRYNELVPDDGQVEAGIDVGGGGDRTVMFERRGPVAGRVEVFRDSDPMRTVGRLVEKINEWGVTKVKVDSTGIGWALTGRLRELSSRHNAAGIWTGGTTHNAEVVPVNAAESPSPRLARQRLNRRAELWWDVGRESSRLKLWDLTSVSDDVVAELCEPRYEIMDSGGKIKIERKDEVIKRLGRSPDLADALLLAFFSPSREIRSSKSALDELASKNLLSGLKPI
jgi:hypothetical protein